MTSLTEHTFNADIQQLMHIIIHTFYSNKDVFLRELISNASDALDKLRYQSLQNTDLLSGTPDMHIRIHYNKDENILTITDTGIGMNKEDIMHNIGTIASSGTKRFLQALEEKKDMNLIGQFGVGFYSAFLVASKVVVHTRKAGEAQQYRWESDGSKSYTLEEETHHTIPRGTSIELYLNEDASEYGSTTRLCDIVKTHSQFVAFPIQLFTEKTREVKVETPQSDVDKNIISDDEDDDKPKIEEINDEDDESDNEKKEDIVTETYTEWDTINELKPIWLRDDVEQEEYESFYKSFANETDGFRKNLKFNVEGSVNVNGLLFIPKQVPHDLFEKHNSQYLKLFVKRVFITDKFDDMLPQYLKFIRGVIDSDDLPLTVSREMLQHNRTVKTVKKTIVKQSLKLLNELAKDETEYTAFYRDFSKNIKLGFHEDNDNREKLTELLRFETSKSNGKLVSFQTYVNNMKDNQPGIYYITGESMRHIKKSPFLKRVQKKGFEVIFMDQAIDEYVCSQLTTYSGKTFYCITKENANFGDDENEKKELEKAQCIYEELCKKMVTILSGKVQSVKVGNRTVDTPCCLVAPNFGMTANMERIMKAQTLGKDNPMIGFMSQSRILEINPYHSMIKGLAIHVENGEDVTENTLLLYQSALLSSGFTIDNPDEFVDRIYGYMNTQITSGLDLNTITDKLNVHYEDKELSETGTDKSDLDPKIETIIEEEFEDVENKEEFKKE